MRKKKLRVAFCVSGKGRLFQHLQSRAKSIGFETALVIADSTADLSLERFCHRQKISCCRIGGSMSRKEAQKFISDQLSAAEPDLIFLTFNRILSKNILKKFKRKIVNAHLSLLPLFAGMKGLDPVRRSLAEGHRFAGATIHRVTEKLDAGEPLIQCVIPVGPSEAAEAVGKRLFEPLKDMSESVIRRYVRDFSGRRDAVSEKYEGELIFPRGAGAK